jgi:hypothetical protein
MLQTRKMSNLYMIYNLLYKDNGFYLQRKKDVFDKIITDYPIQVYSSKYIGVHFKKDTQRYISYIHYNNNKSHHIGSYKTEIEAAIVYNNKIDELGLDKTKNVIEDLI